MKHVVRPYIGVGAVLATGGLIAAAPAVTPSLPDVQVRDFGLTASLQANLDSPIDVIQNHVQQALTGGSDLDQSQIGLGDLLFDRGDSALNGMTDPTPNVSDLTLDQSLLSSLLGTGFDAQTVQDSLVIDPGAAGASGLGGGGLGGLFGSGDQGAINAANAVDNAIISVVQGLPAAYEAFTSGVASMEEQLNSALVDAQAQAAGQLGSVDGDLVNDVFEINNTVLAHSEDALNNLLGVPLSSDAVQAGLLGAFDPASAQVIWNDLMGLGPADFTAIVNAASADNLLALLAGLDWSTLFPGLS
jgi:hypothetical protein